MQAPTDSGVLQRHAVRDWAQVCALLALATLAGLMLDKHVSLAGQAMVYVLAVVIAAYRVAWVPAAVCAVGGMTALNFFFVPPRFTLDVASRENVFALAIMLAVALLVCYLATALRRETGMARLSEARARQLQGLASDLAAAASPADIQAKGQQALSAAFDMSCTLVLSEDGRALIDAHHVPDAQQDGLRCCMREAAVLGPGTGRWPGLNAWYLPLEAGGQMMGAACVPEVQAADTEGREHAQALCALVAQALERLRLARSVLAAEGEVQRQQLQSTYLAAVSHDIRTPLAAIMGAASSLQTQRERLPPAEQDRLLGSIMQEADYLSDVAENTLQLVRLMSTGQALRRDWESLEEIVGAVLARVRQRDTTRRITSNVPAGLPLVRADPVLLAQMLGNLLDNALKYSDGPVTLGVTTQDQTLVVSVKDRGPGVAEADRATLFEPYARGDQSGYRGAGLGLAVCRAIAEAHGGAITMRHRQGGGSCFSVTLPLDPSQPAGMPA